MFAPTTGVLRPELKASVVSDSLWLPADTVGESAVKGRWKDALHVLGVPGTYGKGYDGVRSAEGCGVGAALPFTVLTDSVDSVEAVCKGLSKDAANVGDRPGLGVCCSRTASSLMEAILRIPPELVLEDGGPVAASMARC